MISNQLISTTNAKDINTNYYVTNSCLIKTGIMKMYGILFFCFIDALESFRFPQKVLNRFSKDFTNGNYGRSPVCLHTPLVSFNLTPISKGFEKVCLGDF